MNLVSIHIITDDVDASAAFYERVTGLSATRLTPQFAEIRTPSGTLAIGHTATVALFGADAARPADNHTAIIEFLVDDVDATYDRLRTAGAAGTGRTGGTGRVDVAGPDLVFVQEPTTMPWGNRSLLLRDPDGTLVNLFTPVSAAAVERFAGVPR
ncbi:VOC family protein [Curtobacterium sp. Leaf261]|uniref:VOC family protein n=1 Tax=Curtobacterium sp. Leaf261 TaxID=1736311 RepID=UPI000701314A|nr:VOC family protein [Curtobacterium sp. Leaf261]KQO61454.1 glyoxalase [Curtobacterium sp. Leaf261]